mgnify:CR=1 FL=1
MLLRQLGFTVLGVLSLSSGFTLKPSAAKADTVPPRCPVVSANAPRPRNCTITSFPESSTTPPADDERGSGRNLRDKQRSATKPYYPPDNGHPTGTTGSGRR